MFRKIIKVIRRSLWWLFIAGVVVFGLPNLAARIYSSARTFTLENAPTSRVAIVFGAGLNRNGTPSVVLRDRIDTAIRLYENGQVDKLLMSGDNRFVNYNEPGAMFAYAVEQGIPEEDIVLDYAGRRTYDTCYRAQHIFGVTEAILVTQGYHLPRALVTCNSLGLTATGVSADIRRYRRSLYAFWIIREVPATSVALWEVWVSRPLPVLGDPEPIFINRPVEPIFQL